MNLIINGVSRQYPEGMTVQQLLEQLELSAENVVVELNRKILTAEKQKVTELRPDDTIELVQFVGGG